MKGLVEALAAIILCACAISPTVGQQPADNQQLVKSFEESKSPQSSFAKGREGNTFYMALRVANQRPELPRTQCVDSGFISWIRKFFRSDSAQITLVVTVIGPGETSTSPPRSIPLFQISRNEQSHPPSCLTDVQSSRTITQYYLTDPTHPFQIQAQILTQSSANVAATATLLSSTADVLSFTGGSATLTSLVASGLLGSAVNKVDQSLAQNWSASQQAKYAFEISAWPEDGDWDHHKDQADFASADLIPTSTGIHVSPSLIPTLSIFPIYQVSLFGSGVGRYYSVDRIMDQKLVAANLGDLLTILRNGVNGFTTDQAKSISDPNAMRAFCSQMRVLFAQFLTDDDALAARYAVLKSVTNYMTFAVLRQAGNCIDSNSREKDRLTKLNATFVIDDISRSNATVRDAFVDHRAKALAVPLSQNSKAGLRSLIPNEATFQFDVSPESQAVFPVRPDGKAWGGLKGLAALDQLIEGGGVRLACARAPSNQSASVIAAVVQNKKTTNSTGVFIQLGNSDPPVGATVEDADAETVRLKAISFYPLNTIKLLLQMPDWPATDCPLL